MNKTRLLSGFMGVSLALSLAACGNGGNGNSSGNGSSSGDTQGSASPAGSQKAENVTISFAWWGNPQRDLKYNGIADMFQKEHPNVKIERQSSSFGDYWNKLATQAAGGNAPDVVGMNPSNVSAFATRGALIDLEPYIQDGTIDLSNFPDAVKNSGKFDGRTLMISQGYTISGWEFNQGALKELGVADPDFNWTWDDFIAKATEIQKAINASSNPKRWASVDGSNDLSGLKVFARQRGKELFMPDGKLGLTKQDMVDWFSIWDKLRQGKMIPDAATGSQYANSSVEQSLFGTGKVILTTFPFNQIPLYQGVMKDTTVQPLRRPTDPNGKDGEYVEGAHFAITKDSKHPKEAAEFINFFINNAEAQKTFKLEQGALGSSQGNETIKPLLSPAEQATLTAIQTAVDKAGILPLEPKGATETWDQLKETADKIAFGKQTVDAGAQEFVDKTTQILSK